MLEKLCSLAGTDNFYAEHVGQKKFAVAAAENSRMLKHQHAHKVYEDFKRNKRNQLGPLKKKISLDCSYISNQHFDGEERSSFPVEHPNDEWSKFDWAFSLRQKASQYRDASSR